MTYHTTVAYVIFLSVLTAISATQMGAQQRWNTNTSRQTYTPPPAPRNSLKFA